MLSYLGDFAPLIHQGNTHTNGMYKYIYIYIYRERERDRHREREPSIADRE